MYVRGKPKNQIAVQCNDVIARRRHSGLTSSENAIVPSSHWTGI